MKVLIVGLGSIAKKHIAALRQLVPEVKFMALRSSNDNQYEGIINFSNWSDIHEPDFIIISNPTNCHAETIQKALAFDRPLFIEKPVVSKHSEIEFLERLLREKKVVTYVACNLRFHKALEMIKEIIPSLSILEVNVYCGSNLSQWRPGANYAASYSAKREMGGGVHLDLIHEIDYCYWLFGKPDKVISTKRKVSSLNIDSDDFASFQLVYEKFTINILLNYYRKVPKRSLEIVAEQKIINVDLLNCEIITDDGSVELNEDFSISDTYALQMQYFLDCLKRNLRPMNDFDEAAEVLRIALT